MKKAMNLIVNKRGDDSSENRLLTYLQITLPVKIEKLSKIKHHVYKIHTEDEIFILKGFPTLRRLKLQHDFTVSLKKEGFHQTYQFYSFSSKKPLYFDHRYYGCLEYIQPGKQPFYYDTKQQCMEGLELLESFYGVTAKLVDNYRPFLPALSLKDKWLERTRQFMENRQIIALFLPHVVIRELYSWAKWALYGLNQEEEAISQFEEVILHGDTAYHNFLRASNHELYLIDFDLISIGSAVNDYLQFANRMLPIFNWQFDSLYDYRQFRAFLNNKYFLYGLIFPTDIFREWNRLIREKKCHNREGIRPVLELTMEQFEIRKAFVHKLCRLLKRMG